ncbi:hypothetical protein ALC62_15010, partial [Cyphomyrmex costatus]
LYNAPSWKKSCGRSCSPDLAPSDYYLFASMLLPLSDCFRLPVRDRSYPTIVILWPQRIDIGVDKAAADFVPRRDCPRMISDPSSSGVKTSEEQPSWLLLRIWNVSREILRRFAPEPSQRSYNVEDDLLCREITYYAQYFSSCDSFNY